MSNMLKYLIGILFAILVTIFTYNIWLLAFANLLIGLFIWDIERSISLPVPVSPSFIFWTGHFLSWVFGGIVTFYYPDPFGLSFNFEDEIIFSIRLLNLAMTSFLIGLLFYKYILHKKKNDYKNRISLDQIRWEKSYKFFVFTILVVVLAGISSTDSMFGLIVTGLQNYIRYLILALLGVAIISENIGNNVKISLGILVLATAWSAVVTGGRAAIFSLIFVIAIFSYWRYRAGKIRSYYFFGSVILILIFASFYASFAVEYRTTDSGFRTEERSFTERYDAFISQLNSQSFDLDLIGIGLQEIGRRAYIQEAAYFMGKMRERPKEPNYSLLAREISLQHVPKFLYKRKGLDRNTYVLRNEGIIDTNHSVPLTLLGDSFYRFGLGGVIAGFYIFGIIIPFVCVKLFKKKYLFWNIIYLSITVFLFRIYNRDIVDFLTVFTYEVPIWIFFGFILFKTTGLISNKNLPIKF